MESKVISRRRFSETGVWGLTATLASVTTLNATPAVSGSVASRTLELFTQASHHLREAAEAESVPAELADLRHSVAEAWEGIAKVAIADMQTQISMLSSGDLESVNRELINLGIPHLLEIALKRSTKEDVLTVIEGVGDLIPGKVARVPIKGIIRAGTGLFRFFEGLFS